MLNHTWLYYFVIISSFWYLKCLVTLDKFNTNISTCFLKKDNTGDNTVIMTTNYFLFLSNYNIYISKIYCAFFIIK